MDRSGGRVDVGDRVLRGIPPPGVVVVVAVVVGVAAAAAVAAAGGSGLLGEGGECREVTAPQGALHKNATLDQ